MFNNPRRTVMVVLALLVALFPSGLVAGASDRAKR